MNQTDYTELKSDLVKKLLDLQEPIAKSKEAIQAEVDKKFLELSAEGKLHSLTDDEVQLIMDFRKWSASPGSASGVFHWRKKYGN